MSIPNYLAPPCVQNIPFLKLLLLSNLTNIGKEAKGTYNQNDFEGCQFYINKYICIGTSSVCQKVIHRQNSQNSIPQDSVNYTPLMQGLIILHQQKSRLT